jgi:hypothetical protein
VVPRLLAAGADLERIEMVQLVCESGKDRMFSLVTDLDLLRQTALRIGNVKMIQIDPITAYLGVGQVDSYRTTDVRAVLAPVTELASELMVSIVGIMHFNKRTDVTNALLRISDSLAFGATARHVYAVVDDAENKRKLLVKGKNNLAPRDTRPWLTASVRGSRLRTRKREKLSGRRTSSALCNVCDCYIAMQAAGGHPATPGASASFC